MSASAKVLVVDDEENLCLLYREELESEGYRVKTAQDATVAMKILEEDPPDVVVMDIRMPNGSGIDACRTITGELPSTPVIMLTTYADSDALFAAIDAGASGYVLKRVGSTELVDAVRTVAAGGSLLDPSVTRRVLDRIRSTSRLEEAGAFADLTEQERKVLAHLADGASNRDIAARMGLAEKTIRNYVSSVLAKLALESRAQAAGYAIRNRLPELDEVDA